MTDSTAIIVTSSPLDMVRDLTLEAVQQDFAPVKEWRYSFQQQGATISGMTADGVQDGVRQMARRGEAIRCLDVRLEKDNEHEAFFVAHAARYAIAPDGREILLDSTVRAKRITKDGNRFWFEQGVTKAARNAEEALMPEALKQWMLAQSAGITGAEQPRRAVQAPPRPAPPRPSEPKPEPERQPSFDEDPNADVNDWWKRTRLAGMDRDVVLEASKKRYGGREPVALTHDERERLYADLVTER